MQVSVQLIHTSSTEKFVNRTGLGFGYFCFGVVFVGGLFIYLFIYPGILTCSLKKH